MYICGFSGPPGSGKDSIAREIASQLDPEGLTLQGRPLDTYIVSLAGPMRRMGMEFLGINPQDDELYAKAKQEPQELFKHGGPIGSHGEFIYEYDTLRQFMIWLSEDVLKFRYGPDFWARKLKVDCESIWNSNCIILVPDFGFQAEVDFFTKEIGGENLLVVQVDRQDCDFSNDSRTYVKGRNNIAIDNNSTLGWAAQQIIAKMINAGWKLD